MTMAYLLRSSLVALVGWGLLGALPRALNGQSQTLPLTSPEELELHNVEAAPVTFQGRKALRVTISEEAQKRLDAMRARQQSGQGAAAKKGGPPGAPARLELLGVVPGVEFHNGVIEVDLAGEPASGATGGARGFVGVAFRVQPEREHYDCFYLRPTNGRSDDQERRNHTAQYIAHPDYPWFRLRRETPSKYESWADIGPGEWIHVKIEVEGEKARLFVNNSEQPALVINDVKSGPGGKGKVALWVEGSTVAHFANLKIAPR